MRLISTIRGGGTHPRWRRDAKEIYYVSPQRKLMVVEVNESALATGRPRELFQTPVDNISTFLPSYYVSSDDQQFLINTPPEGERAPAITVVLNMAAQLRRR